MADGVTFYKGSDTYEGNGNTQPDEPKRASGGPVQSPSGLDDGSSFDKTTPSWDNVGNVPRGDVMDSPTDK